MFSRRRQALAMAPVVQIPSGNVDVVPRPRSEALPAAPDQLAETSAVDLSLDASPEVAATYSIRTEAGDVVRDGIADHASASRMLGALAARGARLPLIVYAPDGRPTGERLG